MYEICKNMYIVFPIFSLFLFLYLKALIEHLYIYVENLSIKNIHSTF